MARIKVPTVPTSAYDEDRQANDLLLAHIANLEAALGKSVVRRKGRLTEGEAAQYIRHLSQRLHHKVLLEAMPIVTTPVGVALRARAGTATKATERPSGRKKR